LAAWHGLEREWTVSLSNFDSVKRVFDERSMYGAVVQAGYMRHGEVAARLAAWARKQAAPLRIVDLGCGDAWLVGNAFRDANVAHYLGVDVSDASLERAGHRLQPWQGRTELVAGELAGRLHALPAESANVVLASYSLHHLSSESKAAVLLDCHRVMTCGGAFFWIDVYRRPDESRQQMIARLTAAIERGWTLLTREAREQACAHICESDFPETVDWMRDRAEQAGLKFSEKLFEDEFFTGLGFCKTRRSRQQRVGNVV
jgi:ubiquinone/menaquinone biosynthesis C-methylase UbiE